MAADGAPCLGDRGQGRLIEGGQGAAQGGGGGGWAEHGPVVQAQTFGLGKVAASQHDRDGQVDQGGGSVPPGGGGAGGQVRGQGLGEAGAVGEFAEQEGSGVPVRLVPSAVTDRRWSQVGPCTRKVLLILL